MGEKLNGGMKEVRSPQRHDTVLMAEMDDGAMSILSHGSASTSLRPVFCQECTGGRVLVFEIPRVSLFKRRRARSEG